MKTLEVKWSVFVQFTVLILSLFSEVNGKLLCGRRIKMPKLPDHTRLTSKQLKNDYVTLICDKGYYFSRGKYTKAVPCKIFKKFTIDEIPKCKGCGKPPAIKNGTVTLHRGKTSVGSTASYSCDVGFSLVGKRRKRRCRSNLRWSGGRTPITCSKSHCRNPGTPDGTKQIGRKYNEGNIVKYECKDGLKLYQGSRNRTCLKNGTWSGSPLQCVSEYCSGTNVKCPSPDARARGLNRRYKGGLDLIFVLDTSSNIKKRQFEIARAFVKTIIKIFGVDPKGNGDGTHIACVTYGTRAQTEFTFNAPSVQTLENVLKRVDKIRYTKGATATGLVLDLVSKKVLTSSLRPNSKKALFLVSGSDSNVGRSAKKAANYLKNNKHVEIYVIGIGTNVPDDSLRELASNQDNVLVINSYKELTKLKKWIVTLPVKDYSECGASPFKPNDGRARIVGGVKTNERYWPWMVQILFKGNHRCAGTLINLEYVLTAAHCLDKPGIINFDVKVVFQETKRKQYIALTSLELHVHPGYNSFTYVNDIALVKIPKLKRFTRNQQAICLPRKVNSSRIIKPGNNMYAVGWGSTKKLAPGRWSSKLSNYLKHVKLPFMSDNFCNNNVKNKILQGAKNWVFNRTTQFCAGDLSGTNDTCSGDNGGPAMVLQQHPVTKKWRWFQIGIVSWGNGCAQKGEVAYYTRVSAFAQNWIDKTAKIASF